MSQVDVETKFDIENHRKGCNMSGKDSPQNVIDSYKKRQKMMPMLIWGLAGVLVLAGIIILISWFAGPNRPVLFPTQTPTVTATFTPTPVTPTATFTPTPTVTETPTITPTFTPSGPFDYTVQDGDTCWDLAAKYEVDILVLLALNNFPAGTCPIKPGDVIKIPAPGQELPTSTPLPTGLPRGTIIEYTVQTGETLAIIAAKFNSTVDDIMTRNKITDPNTIYAGQILKVAINLVTPTPTRQPTLTPLPSTQTLPAPTATP